MAVAQFDQAVPVAEHSGRHRRAPSVSRALHDRLHPRPPGRRTPRRLSRLPRPALEHHRADEGRHPLRPRGHARRVRCARDVDDVEVLAAPASVRRREGRRSLRSEEHVARRARAADAALHLGAPADHRAEGGHPSAGHGDERADDGVDDGHVLDAERLRRAGDRDREADLDRRLRLPAGGDRSGRRHGDRARVRPSGMDACRPALRRAGVRQRRGRRSLGARWARRDRDRRLGRVRRAPRRERARHRRAPRLRARARFARRLRRREIASRTTSFSSSTATFSSSPRARIRSPARTRRASARA